MSNNISAEEIEKLAEEYKNKPYYKNGDPLSCAPQIYLKRGFIAGFEAARQEYKLLNNNSDGWISVEDRLPEEDEKVLIFNGNKKITCSFFTQGSRFIVEKNHTEGERTFVSYWQNVTHWMPLPNPPIK